MMQNTLQEKISFSGFGVHSAIFSKIEITPAPADAGIAFVHGDFLTEPIKLGCEIPLEAMHATVLKQKSWVLSTVEHLIAALRMTGIDNATIFIKGGSEIPILDGSAAPFFNRICRVGLVNQGVQKKYLMPRAEISLVDDQGNRAITLKPLHDEASYGDLYCDYQASFNHFVLGYKRVLYKVDQQLFRQKIAPARTFGFLEQLPFLRSHKLAMASSLGNTLVFTTEEAINESRLQDEWLSHKILDFIGDLGLLPHPFTGYVEAAQTGHAFNRRIIEHYLTNPADWLVI